MVPKTTGERPGELVAELGSRESFFLVAPNAMERGLTREEKALVSNMGGGCPLGELLSRCGLPEAKAVALLQSLKVRGILLQGKDGQPDSSSFPSSRNNRPSSVNNIGTANTTRACEITPLAEENVELDEVRKKEILEHEARASSEDLFTILGVDRGAGSTEIKKAYYGLTKRFHPDRYYGKSLGSFRERIEYIFKRFTEAQTILCDPARRQAYFAEHPELNRPQGPTVVGERSQERRMRFARHPYLAKHGKFRELMNRGKELMEKGEFAKALADFSLAEQVAPTNRDLAELARRARQADCQIRAQSEYKEGVAAATLGNIEGAVARIKTACQLDPLNSEYAYHAARLLLQFGGKTELREAHGFARRAVELAPNNVEYRMTFANLLYQAGLEKNAVREYETVLRQEPNYVPAKEQLKKLKRKF